MGKGAVSRETRKGHPVAVHMRASAWCRVGVSPADAMSPSPTAPSPTHAGSGPRDALWEVPLQAGATKVQEAHCLLSPRLCCWFWSLTGHGPEKVVRH